MFTSEEREGWHRASSLSIFTKKPVGAASRGNPFSLDIGGEVGAGSQLHTLEAGLSVGWGTQETWPQGLSKTQAWLPPPHPWIHG